MPRSKGMDSVLQARPEKLKRIVQFVTYKGKYRTSIDVDLFQSFAASVKFELLLKVAKNNQLRPQIRVIVSLHLWRKSFIT